MMNVRKAYDLTNDSRRVMLESALKEIESSIEQVAMSGKFDTNVGFDELDMYEDEDADIVHALVELGYNVTSKYHDDFYLYHISWAFPA